MGGWKTRVGEGGGFRRVRNGFEREGWNGRRDGAGCVV